MANDWLAQTRVAVLGSGVVGQRLAAGFEWLSGDGADVRTGSFGGARGSFDHGFKLLVG